MQLPSRRRKPCSTPATYVSTRDPARMASLLGTTSFTDLNLTQDLMEASLLPTQPTTTTTSALKQPALPAKAATILDPTLLAALDAALEPLPSIQHLDTLDQCLDSDFYHSGLRADNLDQVVPDLDDCPDLSEHVTAPLNSTLLPLDQQPSPAPAGPSRQLLPHHLAQSFTATNCTGPALHHNRTLKRRIRRVRKQLRSQQVGQLRTLAVL